MPILTKSSITIHNGTPIGAKSTKTSNLTTALTMVRLDECYLNRLFNREAGVQQLSAKNPKKRPGTGGKQLYIGMKGLLGSSC